jgi:hypothetical protein
VNPFDDEERQMTPMGDVPGDVFDQFNAPEPDQVEQDAEQEMGNVTKKRKRTGLVIDKNISLTHQDLVEQRKVC